MRTKRLMLFFIFKINIIVFVMFRNSFQKEYATVLFAGGPSPLGIWGRCIKNGYVKRVYDDILKTLSLEICGPNISTCYIFSPSNVKQELAISLPILVLNVKNLMKYFSFSITIIDDQKFRRRIRLSNFQSCVNVGTFEMSTPLCLNSGWNQLKINLQDLTNKAWNTNFLETARIQINANCRIRSIFFCKHPQVNETLPQQLRLVAGRPTISLKKKKPKAEVEVPPPSDAEDEGEQEEHVDDNDSVKPQKIPDQPDLPKLDIKPSSDEEEETDFEEIHHYGQQEEISDIAEEDEETEDEEIKHVSFSVSAD